MPKPTTSIASVTKILITTIALAIGIVQTVSAQQSQHTVSAPTLQLSSVRLTDLESAFWVCDYLATTQGNSDISTCAAIYEAVKQRKFDGDFDKLVIWWRQNKVAQHQNIAAAASAQY